VGSGVWAYRTIASEQSAPGKVVQMTKRTSAYQTNRDSSMARREEYTQDFYYPVVEFTPSDGRKQTVQLAEGSWPPAYQAGEVVTVRYNPGKPSQARIDSVGGTMLFWILPMITGGLAVSFSIAVLVIRYAFRADMK
jgi:hypothetical protein